MLYNDLVNFIGGVFQIPVTNATAASPFQDPSANTILPRCIEFIENMINVDMDFVGTRRQDISTTFTPNSRSLTLPSGCRSVEGVAQISPAGLTPATGGTRNQLEPVSLDVIDMYYPTESTPVGISSYYAMRNDTQIVVGQTPDAAYTAEITGIFFPTAMSSTNLTTYIGTTYPQLMMAAAAYFMAGYQRDFGAQSEDPKLASSWKATYDYLLPSCVMEEKRRKGESIQTSRSSSDNPKTQQSD